MLEKALELLFPISPLVSSFGVQKLTFSSVSPNFTHKDTEKNRKSENFKIVPNRQQIVSTVSSVSIWGL